MLGILAAAYFAPGETIPLVQLAVMVTYPLILILHLGLGRLRRGVREHWPAVLLCLGYQLAFVVVDPTANWWCDYYRQIGSFLSFGDCGFACWPFTPRCSVLLQTELDKAS